MPYKNKPSTTPAKKNTSYFTIGLFVNSVGDNYEYDLFRGVQDSLQNKDVKLVCFAGGRLHAPQGFEAQRNVLYQIAQSVNLDGLIIPGTITYPATEEEIETFFTNFATTPIITVALSRPNIPSIRVDNNDGIKKLVNHLIKTHNCKKIAFIGAPEHRSQQDATERYDTFVKTMAENNLNVDPALVVVADYTYASGKTGMESLLKQQAVQFDAVIAGNDSMALGAIDVLRLHGIRVPEDVAVTGFDDREEGKYATPPLTTARQAIFEYGQRITKTLLGILAGETSTKHLTAPAQLVVRQSCGCTSQAIKLISPSDIAPAKKQNKLPPLEDRKKLICTEMAEAAPALPVDFAYHWAEKLFEAFYNVLSGKSTEAVLVLLREGLQETTAASNPLAAWHNMISVLRRHTIPYLHNTQTILNLETMWQQCRLTIADQIEWVQVREKLDADYRNRTLQRIGKLLDTASTVPGLMNTIYTACIELNIKSCYLSLYENPKEPELWANLVLAYNSNGRIDLPESGLRFNAAQLVPNGLLDDALAVVIEALYVREHQLGFLVLEIELLPKMVIDTLCSQISSALQRVLLLERQKQVELELTQQAKQLEAVALMSIATSTILNSQQLLQTVVELTKESFGLAYVNIGLISETGDALTLAASTGNNGKAVTPNMNILLNQKQSLVAKAARLRQGYIANNVEDDPHFMPHPLMPNTRSEMIIPMIVADELIGVLDLQSSQIDRFSNQDLHVFSILASQVAVALENARRFEKERQITIELEDTGNFLDSIIENIPNPLTVKTAEDLRFVRFNKASEDLTGFNTNDVIGKTAHDVFPKEEADIATNQDKIVLSSGKAADVQQIEIKSPHGIRILLSRKAPIYGSDGEIKYILGVFEDITQQKQTETALTEERNLLRTVIDNIPDYVYVKDTNSKYLINNLAHLSLMGATSQEELAGKTDYDVFAKDLADKFFSDEQNVMQSGVPLVNKEEISTNFAGQTAWVLTNKVPLLDSHGEITGLVGVSRDISEYKHLIQQIQESLDRRSRQVATSTEVAQRIAAATRPETLFHRIVHLIQQRFNYYHVHVYTLEDQFLIMQAGTGNAGRMMKEVGHKIPLAAKSLVARSARNGDPVLASNVYNEPDWLPNALLPETKAEIAVPIKLGKQVLGVLDIQHNMANSLDLEDEILLMGLCGQIAVAIDYRRAEAKRQKAEHSLKLYAKELERSNRDLQDFAYVASHDLQEPLRKIQAFGDRLQNKYSDSLDERGRDYLYRMHNAAARMHGLIQDLLMYSRVGTTAKPFTQVNLLVVLEGVLSDLETLIADTQAQVKVVNLPTIDADETQMRQLFQNLISNAIKFHKPNVHPVIKISSKLLPPQEGLSESFQIFVKDNGIGFEQKYADRIFGVFQRLHGKGEFKGTGVGLAICKKIAERHNGDIIAKSTPDIGTTFIITLPAKHLQENNQ